MSAERTFHVHGFKYEDRCRITDKMIGVQECSDNDPALVEFGLYERLSDGTLRHISDHPTREEATADGIALGMTNEDDQP